MRCSYTDHSHCWTVGLFYPYYPITPFWSGFAPVVELPPKKKSYNDMFEDQKTQHRHIDPRSFTNKYGSEKQPPTKNNSFSDLQGLL